MLYSAAMAKRSLRFLLYSIHAHLATGAPDYIAFFRSLTSLRGHHHEEGKRQIAVGTATLVKNGTRLFLIMQRSTFEQENDLLEAKPLTNGLLRSTKTFTVARSRGTNILTKSDGSAR
jgi:hypothetical protein